MLRRRLNREKKCRMSVESAPWRPRPAPSRGPTTNSRRTGFEVVNRCAVVPAAAASDASNIQRTLHDANERRWPAGRARELPSTGATSVASISRVGGPTYGSVGPNGRAHPADGAGQASRGGGLYAWTGLTGAQRPFGTRRALSVEWPGAAPNVNDILASFLRVAILANDNCGAADWRITRALQQRQSLQQVPSSQYPQGRISQGFC
jgi:hypothetical protein